MMFKIKINGKFYKVKQEKNLLEVCLSLGINIPHFCYHGALGSVGACRLCAVSSYRDENDKSGRLIMSCMEPVAEGMVITTDDPASEKFRASVLESLMLNHPHDCPVCDEGGECHLQDMTVMTGHAYRNHDFKKRTYTNQFLGPFIHHEMNRCIQCYRCVRFYKDYAGGEDLGVFSAHNHVYFGRSKEGVLESEFSGNLVEVCPTGVFTDKTLKRHFTRKWDLTNAPSVCVHCSVGCNTIAGERYGVLRRIMNRYNGSVNGYFICDRGRFGYEFVNHEKRLRQAMSRKSKNEKPVVTTDEDIENILINAFSPGKKIIGIGSPRASLESNYALMKLAGSENFYHGTPAKEFQLIRGALTILQNLPVRSPSLKDIEKSDMVLILGEDLTHTAPMIALAVRQAARNLPVGAGEKTGIPKWHDAAQRYRTRDMKSPVFIAHVHQTKLDELASQLFHSPIHDICRVAFAIASLVDDQAPAVEELNQDQKDFAIMVANVLKQAKNPVIITGTHCGSLDLLQAAANISIALAAFGTKSSLSFVMPECNSMGLAMLDGKSMEALINSNSDTSDTLIILENDLFRRAPGEAVKKLLNKFTCVLVLDHSENETTTKADVVVPVGTFAESTGTLINNEGRAQRHYRVFAEEKSLPDSWRILGRLSAKYRKIVPEPWETFDQIAESLEKEFPVVKGINKKINGNDFRALNDKIRRQSIRFSGRTAVDARLEVAESKIPVDRDSPLTFSMEGSDQKSPSSLVPFYWTPGWNSPQSVSFYLDEPNGSMKGGDPGLRLIEPQENARVNYFKPALTGESSKTGEYTIVPVYRIFGSEELSSKAEAITERIPKPFILMNEKQAGMLKAAENDFVIIEISQNIIEVQVRIDDKIADRIIGLTVNFPEMPFVDLPVSVRSSEIKLTEQNIKSRSK